MFVKIQTNRAKLRQIIDIFGAQVKGNEFLIAPRPLPKQNFKFYIAFAYVLDGSVNDQLLRTIKNHKIISKERFYEETGKIQYSWNVGV